MFRVGFLYCQRRSAGVLLILALLFFLSGCGQVETVIRGESMGTTYAIRVMSGRFTTTDHLDALIQSRLQEINASMSTYIEDSEISRFNGPATAPEMPFTPSVDFLTVMRMAMELHVMSEGAWDGSLDPLVTLWGFGRDGRREEVPSESEIKKRLEFVDFGRVTITEDGKFIKNDERLSIDLASIAKGYGVDAIATLLKENGFENFLVEVGGELYTSGQRGKNTPWRVGINTPTSSSGFGEVYKILAVPNKGLATSGDYRNYFEVEGRTYSHILDPRTGYPVTNGVVSASVIADSCAMADGLATALMVMGPESGIELVERLPGVEALIIVRTGEGEFTEYPSSAFAEYEL